MSKAYYNEWEAYPAQWLRNLSDGGMIAKGDVDERDIRDVKPEDLEGYTQCHFFAGIGTWSYALRLAGWKDEREVWTGSCPCQPFSVAGKRRGTDDARHLWPEWFRLIRERKPGVIFGEQVASRDGLAWLDIVQADLESAGYTVGPLDLCAACVGAPHIRQRLYFVAHTECRATERYRPELANETRGNQAVREVWQGTQRVRDDTRDGSNVSILAYTQNAEHKNNTTASRFDSETGSYTVSNLSEGRQGELGRSGNSLLLGHSNPLRPEGWCDISGEHASQRTLGQRGATNGFWADAEWLPCRDGKARPTLSRFHLLVNGNCGRMVGNGTIGGEHANQESIRSREVLRELRKTNGTSPLSERAGGYGGVQETPLLRSKMYGKSNDGGNQESNSEEQLQTIREESKRDLRELQQEHQETICASLGRESNEQRPVQFDDFVRLLPQTISLATLEQDRETQEGLLMLLKARTPEGIVLDSPNKVQEVWQSLDEEDKRWIYMETCKIGLVTVPVSPLSTRKDWKRAKMISAIGNAIVAPLAAAFIRAYMDYEHERI